VMSLLPFFRHVKAATDGDKDDREESSCVPSKPVQDKVHHMVHRGWPPIASSLNR